MKNLLLYISLLLVLATVSRAGDQHAEDDAFWADAAALLPGFSGKPAEPAASNFDGRWSSVIDWPHIPVSTAALPDGKLLTFSGQERRTWPGTKTQTYWSIYDPETGTFSNDDLYLDHEMFCAHLVMRADGVLQTNGGRYTVKDSSVFDWKNRQWSRVSNMNDPRWYATTVALADGDVFTVSGSGGPNTAERYDPTADSWSRLSGINWQAVAGAAGFESNWWPYLFVAPEGQLFHFGPTDEMHWVDPNGNGQRVSAGLSVPGNHYPKHAAVAMYESGKLLIAGGAATTNGSTTNLSYTVDLNTTPPTVKMVDPMKYPRRFQSAVMLPSGEVLVLGGNTSGTKFSDSGTVLTPEIWNPKTGKWREVADMSVPRNYHSIGILLSDGTVLAGGGGFNTRDLGGQNHQDAQIFTPPNLFKADGSLAPRPELTAAPEEISTGSVFKVSASADIRKFAAIRLVATTHGWSTDLRYLSIPFSEVSPGEYQLIGHPNPNVMLPGYWMLFALDESGVHSKAKIFHVLPSARDNKLSSGNGLRAEYYDGTFGEKKFERIDSNVNFYWSASSSPDASLLGTTSYSARWTGWVIPNVSGTHTFYATADDGVRLDVDGSTLLDAWVTQAPTEYSGTVDLVAGQPVPIQLEWYQGNGPCTIELRWSAPGIAKEIIPASQFLVSIDSAGGPETDISYVGVDGSHEFFVNGELAGIGTNWSETYTRPLPDGNGATIAIKALNNEGGESIVGDFTVGGKRYVTDSTWKVSTVYESGWEQPGFDDSAWANASETGGLPTGLVGMPKDSLARSIWVADDSQLVVYARKQLGGLGLSGPGDSTLYVGVPYELQYKAENGSDLGSEGSGDSKVRGANLLVEFEFSEGSGSLVADTSGKDNNAVIKERDNNGTPVALSSNYWNEDGFSGSALQMDGMEFNSNSILEIPSSPSLSALTNQITVMAWVNRKTGSVIPQNGKIPNVAVFAHDYSSFFFGYHASQYKLEFFTDNGSKASTYTGRYTPGEWEHLVGTYDGSIARLYVNGQQIGSSAATGNLLINTQDSVYNTFTLSGFYDKRNAPVVAYGNKSRITDELDGSMDKFKLYNVALTAQEIQLVYNSEKDSVTAPVDGTEIVEAATFAASGLPASFSLDAETGLISGTPTMSDIGTYNVTVSVSDSISTVERSFVWVIAEQGGLDLSFDSGADGFEYRDDLFRGTNKPGYASGSWQPDAGRSGGGLLVTLGGLDNTTVLNMSGGFLETFELAASRSVRVSFDYNLSMDDEYEPEENSQLLFSVDGSLVGSASGTDYIDRILDTPAVGVNTTTGWKAFSAEIGPLAAGSHTLAFGVFNNKKSQNTEITYGRFDNIKVSVLPPPNEAPIVAAVPDLENTVGDAVNVSTSASDPEGDALSYVALGLPVGLSIDSQSGLVSGTLGQIGVFEATLVVSDAAGNSATRDFLWVVNPEVAIAPTPASPVQSGESIYFSMPVSGGTNPVYIWNFGDDTADTPPSSLPEIQHAYQKPGRYLVSFTVIDSSGRKVTSQFYQNVRPALAAGTPSNSQTIAYEAREGAADRVWMVNPDNDTVSVFDAQTYAKITELAVGKKPRSVAVLPSGAIWVVNKDSSTLTEISSELSINRTIELPRASQPHGLVISPDGGFAYVSLEALGFVLKLKVGDGTVASFVDVEMHARGLALDGAGETLYVSRFITPPLPGEDNLLLDTSSSGGEVLVVSTAAMTLDGTLLLQDSVAPDSGGGSRGIPNYLGAVALSPTGKEGWIPSKQDNIHRGILRDNRPRTHDSTVRAITSRIDLVAGHEDYESRVDHDDAAIPTAAVYDPAGLYVFVALEASREIAVVDSYGSQELFRFPAERAPQGLCLSPDGSTLFVQNFMSRSLTVHDVSQLVEQGIATETLLASRESVAVETLEPEVLRGKELFYDAFDDRLSKADYMSCASCHNDAGQDGRVWDLSDAGEGIRNTIDLRGRSGDGHGALHWSANFDEVQDFENQIRALSEGTGLIEDGVPNPPLGNPNTGRSADLDALAAYLFSLDKFEPSPYRSPDGELTEEGLAGQAVFVAQNCAACHTGEDFSDSGLGGFHDVGTLTAASGGRLGGSLIGLDTPTLKGVWATPPYLHDGSALTLREAVESHAGAGINDADMAALVSYLLQLGGDDAAPSPDGPSIQSFLIDTPSVVEGGSATLSWTIDDGGSPLTSLEIDGGVGSVVGQTSVTVSPNASAVYTLTATNAIGSASAQVAVTVNQPLPIAPAIAQFTSTSGGAIRRGETVDLLWSVEDNGYPLISLSIDQGVGSVLGLSSKELAPVSTTTYILTAVNAGGSSTAQITIEVTEPQNPGQTPYGGAVAALPGLIQAENYDLGGEGVAYSDRDPGNNGGLYRTEDTDIEDARDTDGTPSLGWFGEGEWTEYSVNAVQGTYKLRLRVASGYSEEGGLNVSIGGRLLGSFTVENTGGWQNWVTLVSPEIEITESGAQVVRLETWGAGANINWFEIGTPTVVDEQPAFSGASGMLIPGRIEAEYFDEGGEGIAYHDSESSNAGGAFRNEGVDLVEVDDAGAGHALGWVNDGEWLEYAVEVTPGDYVMRVRIASASPDAGLIRVSLDGVELGVVDCNYTGGWSIWTDVFSEVVTISQTGSARLRIESVGGGYDLNWLEFLDPEDGPSIIVPTPTTQLPFGGEVVALQSRIQAEDFDTGGDRIAYFDLDPQNNGSLYRDESVDIEESRDTDGTPSLGWFNDGEWTEYTVEATPGVYTLSVRVASGYSETGGLQLRIGNHTLATFTLENTGGWQNWVTLTASGIEITEAGSQVIRVEATGAGANLNWFEFVAD